MAANGPAGPGSHQRTLSFWESPEPLWREGLTVTFREGETGYAFPARSLEGESVIFAGVLFSTLIPESFVLLRMLCVNPGKNSLRISFTMETGPSIKPPT